MSFAGTGDRAAGGRLPGTQLSLLPPAVESRVSLIRHRLCEYWLPACSSEQLFSFVLSLCYTEMELFIGTEKLTVSTLMHQSASVCRCIYVSAYLQESLYAGGSVAEEMNSGLGSGWMCNCIIPSSQAGDFALRQECYQSGQCWQDESVVLEMCLFQIHSEPQ